MMFTSQCRHNMLSVAFLFNIFKTQLIYIRRFLIYVSDLKGHLSTEILFFVKYAFLSKPACSMTEAINQASRGGDASNIQWAPLTAA